MRILIAIVAAGLVVACDQGPTDSKSAVGSQQANATAGAATPGTRAPLEMPEVRGATPSASPGTPAAAPPPPAAASPGKYPPGPESVPAVAPYSFQTGSNVPDPLEGTPDKQVLEKAMTDEDTLERVTAVVSVARRRLPGAVELMKSVLQETDKSLFMRETGLSGLLEHGGAEALPVLWSVLNSDPEPRVRAAALSGIAQYSRAEAARAIAVGIEDESDEVQGMALKAVWALMDRPSQAFPLLEWGLAHPNDYIFQEATAGLGKMPYALAGRMLTQYYTGSKDEARKEKARVYLGMWKARYPELAVKL